jgi:SAM-dependent methyltransferase
MAEDLKREFDRRRPWVTKFVIQGREYGGHYDAANDNRLKWFQQDFPDAQTILELGSLEGGHSFALAALPHVKRVIAVEGRSNNLRRAQFVQGLLGQEKVDFISANLEKLDLASLGPCDVVFCVGLLYHLPKPWKLIEQMSKVSRGVFLWTHYVEKPKANATRHHYTGRLYWEWFFLFEALSGLSPVSFWPTQSELLRMLADYGFEDTTIIEDNPSHEHGPAITLAARQK